MRTRGLHSSNQPATLVATSTMKVGAPASIKKADQDFDHDRDQERQHRAEQHGSCDNGQLRARRKADHGVTARGHGPSLPNPGGQLLSGPPSPLQNRHGYRFFVGRLSFGRGLSLWARPQCAVEQPGDRADEQ
jgi:hypothetical protein